MQNGKQIFSDLSKKEKTQQIKGHLHELGADLSGIGGVEIFDKFPNGFGPLDVYPDCKSIIIFLCKFPFGGLYEDNLAPYTFTRNRMVQKLENITFNLCSELEYNYNITSLPIPVDEPYEYWDEEKRHGKGIISLKHAGALTGLGVIGKNTLLINNMYGNMMWLGGILTSEEFETDSIADYSACPDNCTICIDSCPGNAIEENKVTQKLCRTHSIKNTPGGGVIYNCNICRRKCPLHKGIKTKTLVG